MSAIKADSTESDRIQSIFQKLKRESEVERIHGQNKQTDTDNEKFREWYIRTLTTGFAGDIDGIRKSSESFVGTADDISNLAAALRTGESPAVFEDACKQIVIASIKKDKSAKKEGDKKVKKQKT